MDYLHALHYAYQHTLISKSYFQAH